MSTQSPSHRVVILGAGFAGLTTALQLHSLRSKKQTTIDITVIDRNDFQLFTPDLYEIATASFDVANHPDLNSTVCISVEEVLGKRGINFVHADITAIHSQEKRIDTSNGAVEYDTLVIALGSEAFYFGIPGAQEHTLPFKTIHCATNIRNRVHQLMNNQENVHVVVCGAGPAGVELAAEMMNYCRKTHVHKSCFRMTLVEGQDAVLSMMHPHSQEIAMKRLKDLGIDVRLGFMIGKVEKGKVISTEGEEIAGDVVIWTGGVKASSVLAQGDLTRTKRGQIQAQKTLQSVQDPSVFALGDAAECEVGPKVYAPQTAHEAVHQAPVVAQNIFHTIEGTPLEQYEMKNEGMVITLGGKHGIVEFPSGRSVHGFIGWFVRRYVDFRHFLTVLPFMQACKLAWKSFRLMIKND